MSTRGVSLPTELLHRIAGCLQEKNDTSSLLNCCLANRTLCAASQSHIFSYVDLEVLIGVPVSFNAFIESPHLAKYVTEVGVLIGDDSVELLRVLPLLCNVQQLMLVGRVYSYELIPETLFHALQQAIFLTITTLEIQSATVPLTRLDSLCPSIAHLTLQCVKYQRQEPIFESAQSAEPLLHSLRSVTLYRSYPEDFQEGSSLMALFCRAQHTLETLILKGSVDRSLLAKRATFLERFGHSLLHLNLNRQFLKHISFQFSHMPQLRTFRTTLPTRNLDEIGSLFDFLYHSLRSCPKPHSLQKLIFNVASGSLASDDAEGRKSAGRWSGFDALLCDRGTLPKFKSVVFYFSWSSYSDENLRHLRSSLPLAHRAGVLSFSHSGVTRTIPDD